MTNRRAWNFTLFLAACLIGPPTAFGAGAASPASPRVLASIKPIHSIVAAVMDGEGTPDLLLSGAASPHSFSLKPSEARKIASADVIFWIGPVLETFLETPLSKLASGARIIALADAEGVRRLPARQGGLWADADEEHSGDIDGHVWLDPANAIAMAGGVARTLAAADPAHAAIYATNAQTFAARIAMLDQTLAGRLRSLQGRPYIVFHDAYRYFEDRYGLSPAGAVTVASDRPAGTRRIEELRARIRRAGAICVFSTPQFSPRIVTALTRDTAAQVATLDDMGPSIPPGPGLYATLLTRLADSLTACLDR